MAVSVKTRERMVGVFVLMTLGAVAAILLGVVSRERLFRREILVKADFDQRYNLSEGSAVLYQGFAVGHVHRITLIGPNEVDVELAILESYVRFISRRSLVAVETSPIGAIVKDNVILVPPADTLEEPGRAVSDPVQAGVTLRFERSGNVLNEATALLETAKRDILPNVASLTASAAEIAKRLNDPAGELRTLLARANTLTQSLNNEMTDLTGALNRTMANVEKTIGDVVQEARATTARVNELLDHANVLAAGLERGEGIAGAVLRDAQLKDDLKSSVAELRDMQAKLNASLPQILGDVQAILASVKNMAGRADQASERMPTLLRSVEANLASANDLLAAVKNHWLLRGYLPEVPEQVTLSRSPRIAPSVGGRP